MPKVPQRGTAEMTSRVQNRSRTPLVIPDVNQDNGDGGREKCEPGDRKRSGISASKKGISRAWEVDTEGVSQMSVHPTSNAMLLTWMQGVPRGSLGAI